MQRDFVESNLLSNFIVWGNPILGMGKEKKKWSAFIEIQTSCKNWNATIFFHWISPAKGWEEILPCLQPSRTEPFSRLDSSGDVCSSKSHLEQWALLHGLTSVSCTVTAWAGLQSLGQVRCFVFKIITTTTTTNDSSIRHDLGVTTPALDL